MLCQVCLEIHMFINLMDCFLPLKTCFAWYSNWYFDPRCATWWQLFHRLNFFSGRFQKIENFVSLKKKLNSIFIISDILNSLKVKIMLWWSATEEKKYENFIFAFLISVSWVLECLRFVRKKSVLSMPKFTSDLYYIIFAILFLCGSFSFSLTLRCYEFVQSYQLPFKNKSTLKHNLLTHFGFES